MLSHKNGFYFKYKIYNNLLFSNNNVLFIEKSYKSCMV